MNSTNFRTVATQIIITTLLLTFSHLTIAQDCNSVYTGECIVYLDSSFNECNEKVASFFIYSFNRNGEDIWLIDHPAKQMALASTLVPAIEQTPGKPIPLDGVLYSVSGDHPRSYHIKEQFCNGHLCGETIVEKNKKKLYSINYDKHWQLKPWSFYFETYKKDKVVKASHMFIETETTKWVEICAQGCQKNTSLFYVDD